MPSASHFRVGCQRRAWPNTCLANGLHLVRAQPVRSPRCSTELQLNLILLKIQVALDGLRPAAGDAGHYAPLESGESATATRDREGASIQRDRPWRISCFLLSVHWRPLGGSAIASCLVGSSQPHLHGQVRFFPNSNQQKNRRAPGAPTANLFIHLLLCVSHMRSPLAVGTLNLQPMRKLKRPRSKSHSGRLTIPTLVIRYCSPCPTCGRGRMAPRPLQIH